MPVADSVLLISDKYASLYNFRFLKITYVLYLLYYKVFLMILRSRRKDLIANPNQIHALKIAGLFRIVTLNRHIFASGNLIEPSILDHVILDV